MANNWPVVAIVLSTYNGARYLSEQLNSLINQTYKNVQIIVRDDGSEDETCEILAGFSRKHERVNVRCEHNIGVVGSFFRLLELVPQDTDYVALCDQDDEWSEDKIELRVVWELWIPGPVHYLIYVDVMNGEVL